MQKGYDVEQSPFIELRSPFTAWEAFKMALLLPTVPVRLCMALVAAVTLTAVNCFAIWGCDVEQPLPRWRRRLVEINCQSCTRVMLFAMGYWRPVVVGADNYQKGQQMGAIAVFNHVSYLDAVLLVWGVCAAGVAFSEYSKQLPILGYGASALQGLFLSAKQQSNTVQRIKQRANDPSMPMLCMAAEGTCSNGYYLLKFRTGAFVPGRPVVPCVISYKLTPFNPAWTRGIITWWHALRMMCQFGNAVTVTVLPPYVPNEAEQADPVLYAANVRKMMADTLGVPMVEQDRSHFVALGNARISVSWDGRRLVAPPGVVDAQGMCDLEPYMPSNFKREPKKNK